MQAVAHVLVYLQSMMIDGPDGSYFGVCVLGLLHKSGNKTTNPHFNFKNILTVSSSTASRTML